MSRYNTRTTYAQGPSFVSATSVYSAAGAFMGSGFTPASNSVTLSSSALTAFASGSSSSSYSSIAPSSSAMSAPRGFSWWNERPTTSSVWDSNISVYESGFAGGTSGSSKLLTKTISLPRGYTVDTSDWEQSGSKYTKEVDYGVLTYDGTKLTYTLQEQPQHGTGATDDYITAKVSVTLLDSKGTVSEREVNVAIYDDAPDVRFYTHSGGHTAGKTSSGTWSVKYGIDGEAATDALQISFDNGRTYQNLVTNAAMDVIIQGVHYGSVKFTTDGKFTFTSQKDIPNGDMHFVLKATDGDADATKDAICLRVNGSSTDSAPHPSLGTLCFYEANLPDGTHPNSYCLTRSICLPRGYALDTAGWSRSGNIYTKEVENGVLKYNGCVLSYTLKEAELNGHGTTDDYITNYIDLTLKTRSGTITRSVGIRIIDDEPDVALYNYSSRLTAGDSVSGSWRVKYGADGEAATEALQVSFDKGRTYQTVTIGSPMDIVIDGINYGKITFGSNNRFTFDSLKTAQNGAVTFMLKATDGDGDSTVDCIRLCISGGNGTTEPGIGPDLGDIFVDEANLAIGTAPSAADLVKIIALPAGYTLDTQGWTLSGGVYTKSIANGELKYDGSQLTYTLTSAVLNASGEDASVKNIQVMVKEDGTNALFKCDLTININDDAPNVDFAGGGKVRSGDELQGTWDVHYGADEAATSKAMQVSFDGGSTFTAVTIGTAINVTVSGKNYGSVIFASDGSYTFTAAAVDAAKTVNMVLKGTDKDGDSDTESIAINIVPASITGPNLTPITVSEEHLPAGTDTDQQQLIQQITLPANHSVDTTGWTAAGGKFTLAVDSGELTYDGTTLTYTLTAPATHGSGATNDAIVKNITINLLNEDDTIVRCGLKITIEDDEPVLELAGGGKVLGGKSISGTWDVQYGADEAATANALQVSFDNGATFTNVEIGTAMTVSVGGTNYGSVIFASDGSYTFTAAAVDAAKTVNMVLKGTDKDGDSDTETVAINIVPASITGPNLTPITVSEEHLPAGTDTDQQQLIQQITLPANHSVDTTGWTAAGGKFTLAVDSGELTYDGTTLTYTLTAPATHGSGATDDAIVKNITINLLNEDDTIVQCGLKITIEDDEPVLELAGGGKVLGGKSISGTWDVQYGADEAATANALQVSFDNGATFTNVKIGTAMTVSVGATNYGSVIFANDGSYTFTAADVATAGTVNMVLKGTDKDGDSDTETVAFNVLPSTISGPNLTPITVSEEHLPNGSNQDPVQIVQQIDLPANHRVDTTGWTASGGKFTLAVDSGELTYDGTQLTYTLTAPATHGTGATDDALVKSITINLLNNDDTIVKCTLDITIEDDEPDLMLTGGGKVVGGKEISGTWDVHYGADEAATSNALQVSFDNGATFASVTVGAAMTVTVGGVNYGAVTFANDGSYTFTAADVATAGTVNMVLKGTDKDGDSDTETIAINVLPSTIVGKALDPISVNEEYLQNGTEHDPLQLVKNITLPAEHTVITEGWTEAGGKHTLAVDNGILTYDGTKLTYTLTDPTTHGSSGPSDDAVVKTITVSLLNNDGVTVNCPLDITIEDDNPSIVQFDMIQANGTPGDTLLGNWDVVYGADGQASSSALQISTDNGTTFQDVTIGTALTLTADGNTVGTITFNADSTYAIVVDTSYTKGVVDLTLRTTDADGDYATQTTSFSIASIGRRMAAFNLDDNDDSLDQFFGGSAKIAALLTTEDQLLDTMKHSDSNLVDPMAAAHVADQTNQNADDELLRALTYTM